MSLERIERIILISLIASLLTGIAVSAYKKARPSIPIKIEKFDPAQYKEPQNSSYPQEDRVNINYANADELMKVKGIGKATANRIVEYRYKNGGYASIDDIKNVKGLSVSVFEKIKNKITV